MWLLDENRLQQMEALDTVVRENANAANMQARADVTGLGYHLRKLIDQADWGDLEFICKDGVKVKAFRGVAGKSPVLDSMLTNGMLESISRRMSLPEIPASALLAILEFLYIGHVDKYQPRDWQIGLEIISAAHFLLVPLLDKIMEQFIMSAIPDIYENLENKHILEAATMLNVAMTFKCLSHDENPVLLSLAILLEWHWHHSDYSIRHLSGEAFSFVLRHTKPEDCLDTSLEEYFRFRKVLQWCLYKCGYSPKKAFELLEVATPREKFDLYSKGVKDLCSMEVVWLPNYRGEQARDEILQILHSEGALSSAIQLLEHIEWERVPPTIFVRIVEPMKLVAESRLLNIFRFHSLHRIMPLTLKWAHSKSYSVHNGGLVIQKSGRSPGSAICQVQNRDNLRVWRFVVQEVDSFCQLGFVCQKDFICNPLQNWNFEGDLKGSKYEVSRMIHWQRNTPSVFFDGEKGANRGISWCRDEVFAKKLAVNFTVEFQYSQSRRHCEVKIIGTQVGTIWADLPGVGVYPAVCVGNSPGARIRLEIVNGFEIF